MDKNGVLTINNWQNGQADSPYTGFDTIRNVDITSTPGVAKIAYRSLLNMSTGGIPVAQVVTKIGDTYTLVDLGTSGVLYKNGVNFTNVAGKPRDMVEYKGYIIISAGSYLHTYGTTSSTAYFSMWQTGFDSNHYLKMVISRSDGFLYITNGANIKRISGFTAGTFSVAPTATLDTAIALPDGYYAVTMAELGSRLMVGTMTATSWSTRSTSTIAAIFPYRIGVSAVNFDDPIVVSNANCVQQIISSNGLIYFTAGIKGNIYISNGTQYTRVRQIPFFNRDEYAISVSYYPNAITIGINGNLYIGTSAEYASSENEQHGIYEINLSSGKYETNLKNVISTGDFSNNYGSLSIGFVFQSNSDNMYYGWQNGASFGVDNTSIPKYTNYSAVIESQAYVIGNKMSPKTFENVEILFGKPLTTEQGIKLYYRPDTISDWTPIGVWDFSTVGSTISIRDKAKITGKQLIQVRIELNAFSGLGGIPVYDNVELLTVTFW